MIFAHQISLSTSGFLIKHEIQENDDRYDRLWERSQKYGAIESLKSYSNWL